MKRLPQILTAEAVIHGVLKVVWSDGYEGVVDLRPLIARGQIFSYLAVPENFAAVAVAEYGHSIYWVNERGEEIDLGADSLRAKAEKQAALLALAS
jgi:Protein of unknown function (DUF2442)